MRKETWTVIGVMVARPVATFMVTGLASINFRLTAMDDHLTAMDGDIEAILRAEPPAGLLTSKPGGSRFRSAQSFRPTRGAPPFPPEAPMIAGFPHVLAKPQFVVAERKR